MRILVIEDDAALATYIRKGLESEHYAVDVALDGEQGALMASQLDYDLLVLDLNLPKLDGISVLRSVRPDKPQLPVLVLTARPRVEDRVFALDSGADDCLNKPFSYSELSARMRALLRRGRPSVDSVLQVSDLTLDRVERKVQRAGRKIELTAKEFALLEYLMRNAGRRITRSMIIEHVWNINFDTSTNVVDVYINYGVGFANLIALPISGKLRHRLRFRQILRELTLEGVISILEGINPRILEAKLNGFLQQASQKHKSAPQSAVESQSGAGEQQ